jgi:hypothetical protein
MKYIRLFEAFENIHKICKEYGITNYTINSDGSIDVHGSVYLIDKGLTKIPLKFRNVSGDFYCGQNKLISLEGCPKSVGGYLDCRNNKLTSLEGCPKSIGGYFDCGQNQLTSLEGCPTSVDGDFSCSNNQLTSLEWCPKSIGGYFFCSYNQLNSLEGCPKSIGGNFHCENNKIRSFESPRHIGNSFYCKGNPIYPIWDLISPDKKWIDMELFNDMDIIQDDVIILDRLNEFLESIGKDPVTEVEGWKCV